MEAKELSVYEKICHVGQLMHQRGLIESAAGNISVRLDDQRILTTPSGIAKGFMKPDDLIIVDLDGNKIPSEHYANPNLQPTSELSMHLEVYKKRSDIHAVVHAHPPIAIALTIAGVSFQRCLVPESSSQFRVGANNTLCNTF